MRGNKEFLDFLAPRIFEQELPTAIRSVAKLPPEIVEMRWSGHKNCWEVAFAGQIAGVSYTTDLSSDSLAKDYYEWQQKNEKEEAALKRFLQERPADHMSTEESMDRLFEER